VAILSGSPAGVLPFTCSGGSPLTEPEGFFEVIAIASSRTDGSGRT
jgi:hypothetical protein